MSIVLYPSNKSDQNVVHALKYLIQYSMSSAYRCKKEAYRNVDILFLKSTIQMLNGLSNHALFGGETLASH